MVLDEHEQLAEELIAWVDEVVWPQLPKIIQEQIHRHPDERDKLAEALRDTLFAHIGHRHKKLGPRLSWAMEVCLGLGVFDEVTNCPVVKGIRSIDGVGILHADVIACILFGMIADYGQGPADILSQRIEEVQSRADKMLNIARQATRRKRSLPLTKTALVRAWWIEQLEMDRKAAVDDNPRLPNHSAGVIL